jgi:hypothetical protein
LATAKQQFAAGLGIGSRGINKKILQTHNGCVAHHPFAIGATEAKASKANLHGF